MLELACKCSPLFVGIMSGHSCENYQEWSQCHYYYFVLILIRIGCSEN